jgi:hypothetical protein
MSNKLSVPENITILPLPPKSPNSTPLRTSGSSYGQLALKPCLQVIQGYRRPLLLRLAKTPAAAMENHVHRPTPMGPRVLIIEGWYNTALHNIRSLGVRIAMDDFLLPRHKKSMSSATGGRCRLASEQETNHFRLADAPLHSQARLAVLLWRF